MDAINSSSSVQHSEKDRSRRDERHTRLIALAERVAKQKKDLNFDTPVTHARYAKLNSGLMPAWVRESTTDQGKKHSTHAEPKQAPAASSPPVAVLATISERTPAVSAATTNHAAASSAQAAAAAAALHTERAQPAIASSHAAAVLTTISGQAPAASAAVTNHAAASSAQAAAAAADTFPNPAAPSISIQNKYLPAGLEKPKNSYNSTGTRDTEWLKNPHTQFCSLGSITNDIDSLDIIELGLNHLKAKYYTSNKDGWDDPAIRRTFLMAGRGPNAMTPQEEGTGRVILVVPYNDRGAYVNWIGPNTDILAIENLTTPLNGYSGLSDLGLLSIRRLAAYMFAKQYGIHHMMMLDDNIENFYLSDKISSQIPQRRGWKEIYSLFQNSSADQRIPYLSARTYRPERDFEPHAESVQVHCPEFNSKIAFMDCKTIWTRIKDPKHLLPVNIKYWGEDYFRQYALHFAGIPVGVLDSSAIILRRCQKGKNASVKSVQTAEKWMADCSDIAHMPDFVQKAYQKLRQEVWRNLSACQSPANVANQDNSSAVEKRETLQKRPQAMLGLLPRQHEAAMTESMDDELARELENALEAMDDGNVVDDGYMDNDDIQVNDAWDDSDLQDEYDLDGMLAKLEQDDDEDADEGFGGLSAFLDQLKAPPLFQQLLPDPDDQSAISAAPAENTIMDLDRARRMKRPLESMGSDLLTPELDAFVALPESAVPAAASPAVLPTASSSASSYRFPNQHPQYRLVLGFQKRYHPVIIEEKEWLRQRWEVVFLFQKLDDDQKVEIMLPVHCALDPNFLNISPVSDEMNEILQDKELEAYLVDHISAVKGFLGLPPERTELHKITPLAPDNLREIIQKAQVLIANGYDVLHLQEQEIDDHLQTLFDSPSLRVKKAKGHNLSYKDYESPNARVKRSSRRSKSTHILEKLHNAFKKQLKYRSIRFDPKMKALKERGFDESCSWPDKHTALISSLDALDQQATAKAASILELFEREGKSESYVQAAKAEYPPNFTGTLMPYQLHGFMWGRNRLDQHVGVTLCDDMGLGKTIQTIALLSHLFTKPVNGPTLVLCPSSVIEYWKEEIQKYLPSQKVLVYSGTPVQRQGMSLDRNPIVISTYDTFRLDSPILTDSLLRKETVKYAKLGKAQLQNLLEILYGIGWIDDNRMPAKKPARMDLDNIDFETTLNLKLTASKTNEFKSDLYKLQNFLYEKRTNMPVGMVDKWHSIVLDEAHHIRNSSNHTTQVALALKSDHRIALTGTPVQNTLIDLYALMNFAIPGFFLNDGEVLKKYFLPIKKASEAIQRRATAASASENNIIAPISDQQLMDIPEVAAAKIRMRKLRALIRPFFMRRMKDQPEILQQINRFRNLAADQVTKDDIKLEYQLNDDQRLLINYLYNEHRTEIMRDIDHQLNLFGLMPSTKQVKKGGFLTQLIKLQQACSDPTMLKKEAIRNYMESLAASFSISDQDQDQDRQRHDKLIQLFQKLIEGEPIESGKVDNCVQFVEHKLQEDPSNRTLIFIWFQDTAQTLSRKFGQLGRGTHIITGSTDKIERHEIVKKFNGYVSFPDLSRAIGIQSAKQIWERLRSTNIIDEQGKLQVHSAEQINLDFINDDLRVSVMEVLEESLKPIIVLNIAAGGEGINLQAGNIVIDFDNWWNPASMDQALARSYRIGQKRKVEHYTMTSQEVHIDALIEENLEQKRILQNLIVGLGDVDVCLKTLRDYILKSMQRKGFKLIEDAYQPVQGASLLSSQPVQAAPLVSSLSVQAVPLVSSIPLQAAPLVSSLPVFPRAVAFRSITTAMAKPAAAAVAIPVAMAAPMPTAVAAAKPMAEDAAISEAAAMLEAFPRLGNESDLTDVLNVHFWDNVNDVLFTSSEPFQTSSSLAGREFAQMLLD